MRIRHATAADVPRINDIYNHYIVETHVSFDFEPWSDERRLRWFESYDRDGRHPVLVAEIDGRIVGTSYAGPYRNKEAYATSVETTVVLDHSELGKGIGRALLAALLEELATHDVHRAYAIVALPNEASIEAHQALGYRSLGVQHEVGRKFGSYWSTELLEKRFDD